MITVGENCKVLSFSNGQTTGLFRASSDWTSINTIVLPVGWNLQTSSFDLDYGISNNHLYRYNQSTFQYDDVYTFPTNQNYQILNTANRVVVLTKNSTFIDNNTNPKTISTNFKIYVIHDKVGNQQTIGVVSVENAIERSNTGSQLVMLGSPLLTKIGYSYFNATSNSMRVVTKHIDYIGNRMMDALFKEVGDYLLNTASINLLTSMDFNDLFLVARNSSTYTKDPAKPPLETAWQFIGPYVIKIRSRDLKGGVPDNAINLATHP